MERRQFASSCPRDKSRLIRANLPCITGHEADDVAFSSFFLFCSLFFLLSSFFIVVLFLLVLPLCPVYSFLVSFFPQFLAIFHSPTVFCFFVFLILILFFSSSFAYLLFFHYRLFLSYLPSLLLPLSSLLSPNSSLPPPPPLSPTPPPLPSHPPPSFFPHHHHCLFSPFPFSSPPPLSPPPTHPLCYLHHLTHSLLSYPVSLPLSPFLLILFFHFHDHHHLLLHLHDHHYILFHFCFFTLFILHHSPLSSVSPRSSSSLFLPLFRLLPSPFHRTFNPQNLPSSPSLIIIATSSSSPSLLILCFLPIY